MCGIVGYVGRRPVQELLLGGLRKLEYRGYDSAGISVLADGRIDAIRAVGNLDRLEAAIGEAEHGDGAVALATHEPSTGIGHTRWATHGRVNEANAHPHFDTNDRVHIVVNGIVENYLALRETLRDRGAVFTSETDAEVIAHLVAHHLAAGGLLDAVLAAYAELEGHFSFVRMAARRARRPRRRAQGVPAHRRSAARARPFFASAVPAFLAHTREVQYIENGEIVRITPGRRGVLRADGTPVDREVEHVEWDEETAEKSGYETFMLKEIHEQADALAETIADRTVREDGVDLDDAGALPVEILRDARRIIVIGCGTSYHAGLIGAYALETWARMPVVVDVASEFRYRNPVIVEGDLVIGITQSGETADTLAAMRLAQERGATVLAITNVMGSQATRDADGVLYTRAGLEVSVAATKTFITQVAVMYLLALRMAELRGTLDRAELVRLVAEMKHIPSLVEQTVAAAEEAVQEAADAHFEKDFFLYIGRHVGLSVALEGALKLKEISYISTDAYAAGEMKHGPIALLDQSTPVVAVATDSPVLEKLVSNMQEVRARGAHVIAWPRRAT
jgi:glucosamine--fructose-6-phosphate aminotransferase (isomerizing)